MHRRAVWSLITGAIGGFLAGLLGIGGGIVLVPLLTGLLWLDQHKAHGTSLAIIIPTSIAGTAIYAQRGDIDWVLVATIASGSAIGAIAGAKIMVKLSAHRLRQVFGLYVMTTGALLLLR